MSARSQANLDRLPRELQMMILSHLSNGDLKSLRQVNHDLSLVANPFLYRQIHLYFHYSSLHNLESLSKSPVLAPLVKSFAVDCNWVHGKVGRRLDSKWQKYRKGVPEAVLVDVRDGSSMPWMMKQWKMLRNDKDVTNRVSDALDKLENLKTLVLTLYERPKVEISGNDGL
ncbi:MAG: hypothetical protein M1834_009574 [Cirrosporium novae-zelandiae]|nr:MAG: hypothetical protein M1834_009574 [Cirrosporium novae-zelandiae]